MPHIKEYVSQVSEQGPVNQGMPPAAAFGAAEGAGLQNLGQGIQDATDFLYKHESAKEVSKLSANMAGKRAEATIKLTEAVKKSDPNDKDFTKRFLEEYDAEMDEMAEGIETGPAKEYFLRANAEQRADLEKSAWAGQAELAGIARVQNWEMEENAYTAAAKANPSQFESLRAQAAIGLEKQVELGMPRSSALQLQTKVDQKLAVETIRGWLQGGVLGPKKAKAELDSKKYDVFLGGQGKDQLYGEISAMEKALIQDAQLKRTNDALALKETQNALGKEFFSELQDGKMTMSRLLTEAKWKPLDSFGEGSLNSMSSIIERYNEQGGKFRSDPMVKNDVWDRIHNLPPGDPRAITDEKQLNGMVGKGLDISDVTMFRKELQDKGTSEGSMKGELKKQLMNQARAELVKPPTFGMPDPGGEGNFAMFQAMALKQIDDYEKQGKDPMELLDPNSKSALHRKIISFKKQPKDIQNERVAQQKVLNDRKKGLTVDKIQIYSWEEITKLDPAGLTAEQQEAARRRYNELAPLSKQK